MRKSVWLSLVALTASLGAQVPDREVEARLRSLEEKAARADHLAQRVMQLEQKLQAYEDAEEGLALEASIDALLAQEQTQVARVTPRKALGIVLGGQLRLRSEYRSVTRYQDSDPGDTDEDFTLQRTRLSLDARLSDTVRTFVEIQDSRNWGEEQSVLADFGGVDLHQGYVDFEDVLCTPFTLRAGRFELKLWNQRLLSPLDWHPVGRSWDGVLLFGRTGDVDLTGGYHILAEDPVVEDTDFCWVSATWSERPQHEVGVAFFWLESDPARGDHSFGTVTLHYQGLTEGFDYGADLAAQFGDSGGQDLEAYALALVAGYTFEEECRPRVGLEWTFATGDEDPSDGELETFNPLFPFGHYYQGYLDVFAWRNGHDVALHLEAVPAERWWAEVAVHGFWLDEPSDAWFGADGSPIRRLLSADETEVGYELDLSAKWWMNPDVWIWFGYSHFFAGSYVEETGDDPDADWIWLQLTASF